MEGNVGSDIQVAARRFWNIVRGMLLVLRKNISKKKPTTFDLDLILSRGKNIIHNLAFHHHHSSSAAANSRLGEYEFSCSNTPARVFPFPFHLAGKRKNSSTASNAHFFACAQAWPETPDVHVHVHDHVTSFGSPVAASGYLRSPMTSSSPALPGFGRTPLVRQLRVTDSPFPIHDVEESYHIDKAAEEFILKFYQHLRKQDSMAKKRNL